MKFGAHHEWGKLREVVIGISPAEDFIVVHEPSIRWMPRLICRQRERYGLRSALQQIVQRGARWSTVPLGSPNCVDGPFL